MTSERRRNLRVGCPLLAGLLCLIAAGFTSAAVGWVLIIVGFGLILDGVTLAWSKVGGTLRDFRL